MNIPIIKINAIIRIEKKVKLRATHETIIKIQHHETVHHKEEVWQ